MSNRSIVEINHDCSFAFCDANAFDLMILLRRALSSGSAEAWAPLERFGIKRITQCHHSDDRKVVVGKGALKQEHEFG